MKTAATDETGEPRTIGASKRFYMATLFVPQTQNGSTQRGGDGRQLRRAKDQKHDKKNQHYVSNAGQWNGLLVIKAYFEINQVYLF